MGDEKTMKHGKRRDKPRRKWQALFWIYIAAALMSCFVIVGAVGGAEWGRISLGAMAGLILIGAAAGGLFLVGAAMCAEIHWKEDIIRWLKSRD